MIHDGSFQEGGNAVGPTFYDEIPFCSLKNYGRTTLNSHVNKRHHLFLHHMVWIFLIFLNLAGGHSQLVLGTVLLAFGLLPLTAFQFLLLACPAR